MAAIGTAVVIVGTIAHPAPARPVVHVPAPLIPPGEPPTTFITTRQLDGQLQVAESPLPSPASPVRSR